uniref:TPT domain-containing protein n=1 Tax=Panagrellus redivivus TaxID=6233 RepID=A0A7E4V9C6_PANRE
MNIRQLLHNPAVRSIGILSVLAITNSLFNRTIMTKFFFDYPVVILMLQMATTLFAIEAARMFNVVKLPAYTFQRGCHMFVPSLFYAISIYLCLECLDGISMPVFPAIQRFLPVVIIAVGVYYKQRGFPSQKTITIVILMCIAAFFSSLYEIAIEFWAIGYGIAALTMHGFALVMIERLYETSQSVLDLIYMNSFNCLCLFLVTDLIQDEIRDAFLYMLTSMTPLFLFCLASLIVIGAAFHAAVFLCVAHANAFHTAIIQNLCGALQIIVAYTLSVYLFYDIGPSTVNIIAVILTTISTYMFYRYGGLEDVVGKVKYGPVEA